MTLRKSAAICLPLIAASMGLGVSAQAAPFLPNVQNLNFTTYSGSAPKNSFTNVNPTGWVGGGGLIYIASNQVGHTAEDGPGLQTYGNPGPNLPGNYVMADGNPDFEGSFSQTITGLTVGATYTLSFYQAGSQQKNFANGLATTEQWVVSLGTAPLTVCKNCGPVDPVYGQTSTYNNADANASVVLSQLMTTPSGGTTDWEYVSVNLKADAATELLSFLAWGDKGSTINLPPIVFLSNTNSPPNLVPEPATLSLMGVGLMGLGAVALRGRAKRNAV